MTRNPLVSVVMPVFNGEWYLRKSVESILNQTWGDFELIVVNDGSTDATPAILASYSDPRLIILKHETNQGLVRSLNLGLERARGDYVARQDADDLALPHRLGTQARFLDAHPEITLVGSSYIEIDQAGRRRRKVRMPAGDLALKWHALFQNPFAHSTVMFRRAAIMESGGYATTTEARHIEDYELWLRLLWSGHRMVNLAEPLVQWRANPGGVSAIFAGTQAKDFRAIVRSNIRKLIPEELLSAQLADLLWTLQVGGGINEPFEPVDQALAALDKLVAGFVDYFTLSESEHRHARRMAYRRAARTLLHNANQRAYDLKLWEADRLARRALNFDGALAFSPAYRKLRFKLLLGEQAIAYLQHAQKRIKGILHGEGQSASTL